MNHLMPTIDEYCYRKRFYVRKVTSGKSKWCPTPLEVFHLTLTWQDIDPRLDRYFDRPEWSAFPSFTIENQDMSQEIITFFQAIFNIYCPGTWTWTNAAMTIEKALIDLLHSRLEVKESMDPRNSHNLLYSL